MTAPNLSSLVVAETQADILAAALQLAETVNLPTTSWQAGDPTRTLFMLEALILSQWETIQVGYISSGFLDYAALPLPDGSVNPWLAILASQVYNVTVPPATYASTQVTLTNSGGGLYVLAPGDVVVKSSVTGATYTSTTGGTLTGVGTPGATLTVTVVADQAGAASTAGVGEINSLVTGLLGVTCTNLAPAVGADAQDPATTVAQCRAKLGSLSPNGPASAYDYVALTPALTGVSTISRSRTYPTSETGDVTVYVAGSGGAVGSSDVAAVQAAILQYAAPLCITPTVLSANPVTINVSYTLWIYASVNQSSSQITAAVQSALLNALKTKRIGGDQIPPAASGFLYQSFLEGVIASVFPAQTFRVTITTPAADIALGPGDVAQLGTVTPAIQIIQGG